jgi:hypothetical protein
MYVVESKSSDVGSGFSTFTVASNILARRDGVNDVHAGHPSFSLAFRMLGSVVWWLSTFRDRISPRNVTNQKVSYAT